MRRSALLLLLLAVACGSAEPLDAGPVTSQGGNFVAQPSFSPDPPVVGANTLELKLSTKGEKAVLGATLEAEPWMVAHGHGSPVVPSISEPEPGRYRIDDVRFTMPGTWEVRVTVTTPEVKDHLIVSAEVR